MEAILHALSPRAFDSRNKSSVDVEVVKEAAKKLDDSRDKLNRHLDEILAAPNPLETLVHNIRHGRDERTGMRQ